MSCHVFFHVSLSLIFCRLLELIEDATDPGIFGQQFFYSYGTDITLTQQRLSAVLEDPSAAQKPQWARADKRFFWNEHLTKPFVGKTLAVRVAAMHVTGA